MADIDLRFDDEIDEFVEAYAQLMSEGDFSTAARLSGELLARIDARWTTLVNRGDDAARLLHAGNFVGARHVESLIALGEPREAFSTAAMLLVKSTIINRQPANPTPSAFDNDSDRVASRDAASATDNGSDLPADKITDKAMLAERADLLILALRGVMDYAESNPAVAANIEAGEHLSAITTLLASLLYDQYLTLSQADPNSPVLTEAYALLAQLIPNGAVCHPSVTIRGVSTPLSDFAPVISDAISRAAAIDLLSL